MKRKTLTTAVLAGLTGMAGMVSVSNAVNLNPDGLGQVLLYPYYSARGGNDTLISIVNTTDNAKSVKIRFLESLNSAEVLDFNIYMSPFDVWVAAVTATDEGGGKIIIPDNSCTVPYLFETTGGDDFGEQEFLDLIYTSDGGDGGPQGIERTASGHIEVIEMGTLTNEDFSSADAATHSGGVPSDCGQLVDAWRVVEDEPGYWCSTPSINCGEGPFDGSAMNDHDAPSGGLYGAGSIINVQDGTMFSYNAVAVDAFSENVLHTDPGSVLPNLAQGDDVSRVFVNGTVVEDTWDGIGIFALNATLMFDTIMNEYVVGGSTDARSEWVVTFPTKRPHVNGESAPQPPFTSVWPDDGINEETAGACEPAFFRIWNREEQFPEEQPDDTDPGVSPRPPFTDPEPDLFALCYEANVIRFGPGPEDDLPDTSEILKDARYTNIFTSGDDFDFGSGWVRFSFNPSGEDATPIHVSAGSDQGRQYLGLPTIGFWVNTFANGALEGAGGEAVLSNYGGSFQHRGSRRLQAVEPQ